MGRSRVYKLDGLSGRLKGTKIYFSGFSAQPKYLQANGRGFAGLKHILELLENKLGKFTLTITPTESKITKEGKTHKVRVSDKSIRGFQSRQWEARRQLSLQEGEKLLSDLFPGQFSSGGRRAYEKDMFSELLTSKFDVRQLSISDVEALTRLAIDAGLAKRSGNSLSNAYEATRDSQLIYLRRLLDSFSAELQKSHDEAWWQTYFSSNILLFQDNYIRVVEKLNVATGTTKYPDFIVLTSDGYLDIIEIKKPSTELLKEDKSRHNFYWSTEIARAISQVENYIDIVTKHSDSIRSYLKDNYQIDLRIIKPRGVVLAGMSKQLSIKQKAADDFRLLNEGQKNVSITPFDELSQRMRNVIASIERLTKSKSKKGKLGSKKS